MVRHWTCEDQWAGLDQDPPHPIWVHAHPKLLPVFQPAGESTNALICSHDRQSWPQVCQLGISTCVVPVEVREPGQVGCQWRNRL